MSMTVRPRRSVLYMPGANTRALEKARTLPADALIFDLEDAVAPDAKETARANVVAAAQSRGYGKREIAIRCNGLGTPWGKADIAAIAKSGADAVVVPKVESAAEVASVVGLLDAAGAPASMAVWAMMETPRGILRAEEVAHAGVQALLDPAGRRGAPSRRAPGDLSCCARRNRGRPRGPRRMPPAHVRASCLRAAFPRAREAARRNGPLPGRASRRPAGSPRREPRPRRPQRVGGGERAPSRRGRVARRARRRAW